MLSAILAFILAHPAELAAAAYALLNLANALVKGPEAKSALAKLADLLAVLARKDAAGTLKLPGKRSKATGAPSDDRSLKALILLPLVFLAAMPACAFCKDATNAAAPRCVLEKNMVKCGETAGFALVPVILGLIANAIAGQPFDAAALESQLLAQGVKDVPCVLAALQDYIAGSAEMQAGDPASILLFQEVHAALLQSLSD